MKIKTIIPMLLLFAMFSAKAQHIEKEQPKHKIGLVLSGGGAKGLAHIGVLKVIDSLGIQIDYVAGTSMGAIIGSLYASGYSGKELDSIFKEIDFDKLISDEIPRGSKAFYERENAEKYAITLPIKNFSIKLPSALSRGQNTYALISKLTLHLNDVSDFSQLPIPFFCIATNVETGKAVLLDSGNLAQAVLASGALPTLFQPVTINNEVLIDGGVVNNYPIDELRAKGMDIIIGVDVQDGLATIEEMSSALDILGQINNFRTINDMSLKVGKTDIYIKPNIKDYTVVSFNEGAKIIENGKQAAHTKLEALKALAHPFQKKTTTKIKPIAKDSITINNIYLQGNKKYTRAYILGKLNLKSNEKISYTQFSNGINNLVATNNFDTFEFKLENSQEQDSYNLVANLKETNVTTFFKLGVHYDDLYKSAALLNLTKKGWLFENDVCSFDVILGDNVRYNLDYYIDKGFYWSIGVHSRFNQFDKAISAKLLVDDTQITNSGLNKINANLQDQTNQIYLQTVLKNDASLTLGLEHKRLEIKTETLATNNQTTPFVFENTDYLSAFGGLKLDTYDHKYFPRNGVYFNGDIHMYLHASRFNQGFDDFSIAKADMGYAFSVTEKLALNLQTSGGFKLGDKSTKFLDFSLGGYGNHLINNFIPFVGYDFISLTGNSYVNAHILADYKILKKHHITLEGNWANIDDDIFDTGEWLTLPNYSGYALGYAIETLIGPVQAKYSFSPELNESFWFFNIGFWF